MSGIKIRNDYVYQLGDLYRKTPKAVLGAIAVSALTTGGDRLDEAQELLLKEWAALHAAGIVPQPPAKPRTRALKGPGYHAHKPDGPMYRADTCPECKVKVRR